MAEAPNGQFIWYELLTQDPEAAIPFYQKVVGWDMQTWEGGEEPYHMFSVGEAPKAGVMQLPDEAVAGGAPSHWLAYIRVADVQATIDKCAELGGSKMMGPMDIPEVGTMAVLADPQGAVFAVFAPANESPLEDCVPGDFSWNELMSSDYEAGFDFYHALVGWDKTTQFDMGDMGIYQMYGVPGGRELGGMMNLPPEMEGVPPHWMLYIQVEDVNEAAERAKAAGGQIVNGPMEVPGGDMIAHGIDPTGAAFALHAVASASADGPQMASSAGA